MTDPNYIRLAPNTGTLHPSTPTNTSNETQPAPSTSEETNPPYPNVSDYPDPISADATDQEKYAHAEKLRNLGKCMYDAYINTNSTAKHYGQTILLPSGLIRLKHEDYRC